MKSLITSLVIISFVNVSSFSSPIKVEIQIRSNTSDFDNLFTYVTFSIPGNDIGLSFWLNKKRVLYDSLRTNGLISMYYVNPSAHINLSLPTNITISEVRIKFYNMNEPIINERAKWVILQQSEFESLFNIKVNDNGKYLMSCKIPLKDLFYYQTYRVPYKRNKDYMSYQVEFSETNTFERGIFISVFDNMNNSYKVYKHFVPNFLENNIYTFEFNKQGKQFDHFEIGILPLNKLDTVLTIEGISITNDIRTQDINSFTINARSETLKSIIKSYPFRLSLNKENFDGSDPNYSITINKLGISYSMIRNMNVFVSIVIFSILLFFGNRYVIRRNTLFNMANL